MGSHNQILRFVYSEAKKGDIVVIPSENLILFQWGNYGYKTF
jgi:hypothetical protein